MNYIKIIYIIPFVVVVMLIIATAFPSPDTIMLALIFSFFIIVVQTIAVLKGDPEDISAIDEIPEP